MRILISRVDSIGDVVLTLPLCGWLKENIPNSEIHFLCQNLTKDIIAQSKYVDQIHIWEDRLPDVDVIIHVFPNKEVARAAKKKKIDIRIGTSHRLFHWTTCNHLIHFSRIKSGLHEAQLNFRLLKGLGKEYLPNLSELVELVGWKSQKIDSKFLSKDKFNLIFHIKSRGSAKEWKSENYLNLAERLPSDKFNIILTGTKAEGDMIRNEVQSIFELDHVTDTTGKLSLKELIQLISSANGLLACSTGPLHIASVSTIKTLGLYPSQRPMHAGRWGPIGSNSMFIEEKEISNSRFLQIHPDEVFAEINSWAT